MSDLTIARAQIMLSALFLGGYFTIMILFMLGYARIPVDYKESFSQLLGLLSAGTLLLLQFWFSRSRAAGQATT
jgi:hypothetical protein